MATNDYLFVQGSVKRETEKAILLDNDQWYPKSQIKEMRSNGILVAKWVVEKKSTSAKPKSESSESAPASTPAPASNSGSEFNEDNLVECRIKLETAKATLVIVKGTGREVWFPKTTIKKAWDGEVFVGIVPQTWIFKKKVESGELKPASQSNTEGETDEYGNPMDDDADDGIGDELNTANSPFGFEHE